MASPKSLSRSSAIAAARAAGLAALTWVVSQPVGRGGRADREDLRFVGGAAPLRVEGCRGPARSARGDRRRRRPAAAPRTGAAISTEAAIAPCHSSSSTSVTAAGRCASVGRGEDRERHAGGGGRRVGAADPGRVVGGEGRVAEFFGRLGRRGLLFLCGCFRRCLGRRRRGFRLRACSSRRRRAPPRRGRPTATRTSPPIAFSAAGIGLRRRSSSRAGFGVLLRWASRALGFRLGRVLPASPRRRHVVAGRSALMGRFPATAGTLQAGRWLAGQLIFLGLVD